jgi:predicted amino acid dehydrogenase
MGAMESQLNKNMKTAKMRERMQAKAQANLNKTTATTNANASPTISEEDIIKIFSTGEKVEKTPRGAKPESTLVNESKPSSKKGKKKK